MFPLLCSSFSVISINRSSPLFIISVPVSGGEGLEGRERSGKGRDREKGEEEMTEGARGRRNEIDGREVEGERA